jgi:hypothetical protein
MRTWLLIVGGILAIQVLLVWGYAAMARKSSETSTSEVVGSLSGDVGELPNPQRRGAQRRGLVTIPPTS